MAVQLGAKEPKREIDLGRGGSWAFVIIFLTLMCGLAYWLAVTFIIDEDMNAVYVKCVDGTVEKLTEGVYIYCGEYVGGDDVDSILAYVSGVPQNELVVEDIIKYEE